MPKKTFAIALIIFSVAIIALSHATAYAVCQKPSTPELQVDWPDAPLGGYKLTGDSKLSDLIGYFFGWGVGLGGLAVFISLIIAGIEYITSVANPTKLQAAKDRIRDSLIGLVLLLSSWAVFQLINPQLNQLKTKLGEMPKSSIVGTFASDKPCETYTDCCIDEDSKYITGCDPKNWLCCRANDEKCLQNPKKQHGKNKNSCTATTSSLNLPEGADCEYAQDDCAPPLKCVQIKSATKILIWNTYFIHWECQGSGGGGVGGSSGTSLPKIADGDGPCVQNADCESNWCNCNYGYNVKTGEAETGDWQKECVPNPTVCAQIMVPEDIGCDFVRFYLRPGLPTNGTKGTDYIDISADAGQFNTNEYLPVLIGTDSPMSYQAFIYKRDAGGNVLDNNGKPITSGDCENAVAVPCGPTACGCLIARCNKGNWTSASGECNDVIVGDPQSSEFSEFAYNAGLPNKTLAGVRIKDKTKENEIASWLGEGWGYITNLWSLMSSGY